MKLGRRTWVFLALFLALFPVAAHAENPCAKLLRSLPLAAGKPSPPTAEHPLGFGWERELLERKGEEILKKAVAEISRDSNAPIRGDIGIFLGHEARSELNGFRTTVVRIPAMARALSGLYNRPIGYWDDWPGLKLAQPHEVKGDEFDRVYTYLIENAVRQSKLPADEPVIFFDLTDVSEARPGFTTNELQFLSSRPDLLKRTQFYFQREPITHEQAKQRCPKWLTFE